MKDVSKKALHYSDCWVEDSRLVFLNVKDAINKGASAFSYSKVTKIIKEEKNWLVTIKGKKRNLFPKVFRFGQLNCWQNIMV